MPKEYIEQEQFELLRKELSELTAKVNLIVQTTNTVTNSEVKIYSGELSWTWEQDFRHWKHVPPNNSVLLHVDFPVEFKDIPIVFLSIRKLDASAGQNVHLYAGADKISTRGFDVQINTWAGSKVYGSIVGWLALSKISG